MLENTASLHKHQHT